MVRLATFLISIVLLSACSSSEGTPAAAAPVETPAVEVAAMPEPAAAPASEEQPAAAPEAAPASENNSALSFTTFGGRQVAIEDYKGDKVVAVLFFSTDCPHCQNTAQILAPIYREYRQKGVEILGLAVNPTAAQNLPIFAQRYGVEFPVGLGSSTQWASFGKFSIMKNAYVPHIMFVGKDGEVAEDHPGADSTWWAEQDKNIRASFDRLLAE